MVSKNQVLAQLRDRTNQKTAITALAFAVLGLIVFLCASEVPDGSPWQALLYQLGSFFLATMLVGFVWELILRRNLLEELEYSIVISSLVQKTGLTGFHVDSNLIKDDEIKKPTSKVDLLLGFTDENGGLWYKSPEVESLLRSVRAAKEAEVRVAIPNFEFAPVRSLLASRLGLSGDKMGEKLKEATDGFTDRLRKSLKGVRWELRRANEPAFYSYVRLDDEAKVLLCGKIVPGQKLPRLSLNRQYRVPAASEAGPDDLFEFFEQEFGRTFAGGVVHASSAS